MSADTNTQAVSLRQEYLSAMGVDCWLPHVQLPGALNSTVYSRAVTAVDSMTSLDRKPDASNARTAAKLPRRMAAGILTEAPAQPQRSSENAEKLRPVITPPSEPAKPLEDVQLNVLLLECPGHCLIIDDAHGSREQRALLGNLMFALSGEPPGSCRATPFDWASIPPQSGAAVDVLRGIVDRAVNQHSIRTIVLMGASSRTLFECDATATGRISTPAWLSTGVQLVATHSSKDLLTQPARKAETWAHVQEALNTTAS